MVLPPTILRSSFFSGNLTRARNFERAWLLIFSIIRSPDSAPHFCRDLLFWPSGELRISDIACADLPTMRSLTDVAGVPDPIVWFYGAYQLSVPSALIGASAKRVATPEPDLSSQSAHSVDHNFNPVHNHFDRMAESESGCSCRSACSSDRNERLNVFFSSLLRRNSLQIDTSYRLQLSCQSSHRVPRSRSSLLILVRTFDDGMASNDSECGPQLSTLILGCQDLNAKSCLTWVCYRPAYIWISLMLKVVLVQCARRRTAS